MYSSVTIDADAAPGGLPTIGPAKAGGFCIAADEGTQTSCAELRDEAIVEVARRPRWSAERTLGLEGRCRGVVLAKWAENCRRHFGEPALRRLRDALPVWAHDLPDAPPEDAWFPVGLQLRLTELVIDELLGGDALALEDLLRADVARSVGRATAMFLRTVGPGPVLARSRQIHPTLYDVGRVVADVGPCRSTITHEDAALFGHPTWALLQLFAHRGFIELTGRTIVRATATTTGHHATRIDVVWRW
jgi:hypothetical protein